MMARHRAQLTELLTHYGKIDTVCLDQWLGPAVWPQLRETIKQLRKLQPEVMFRARGIGNYGDYYTPEGFVPGSKENTAMPWMVIYQLGGMWSYQPDAAKYKGAIWIVTNLVDVVAKGGNFMVGIGPDARGRFHPKAVEALETTGAWLRLNGEAIYRYTPAPGRSVEGGRSRPVYPDQGQSLCLCHKSAMARPNPRVEVGPREGGFQHNLAGGERAA